jgi:hypothetical protein
MTVPRGLPLRLVTSLAGLALAASACGDGGSESAVADPGSAHPSSASASESTAGNVVPSVSPIEQLVRMEKYGVGFGLPKSWLTLEAKGIKPHSPALTGAPTRLAWQWSRS